MNILGHEEVDEEQVVEADIAITRQLYNNEIVHQSDEVNPTIELHVDTLIVSQEADQLIEAFGLREQSEYNEDVSN